MQEVQFPEHGIYAILNIVNDKMYIGSAINFKLRWRLHTNELNRNDHRNDYLQNAWNKYGQENFIFVILETVIDKTKLIEREQYYIDNFKPDYNINPIAGSRLGTKHSVETKVKMSLNQNRSAEASLNKSKAHLGYKQTDEHIKNMVEGRKGYLHSEATRLKISEANKISQSGRKFSEEHKRKISNSTKGRVMSEKALASVRKPKSEEAKANMKLAWIKRKAKFFDNLTIIELD